jgi:hypothetical protein
MRPRPPEGPTQAYARGEDDSHGERGDRGRAFIQNLRRGHCELAVDAAPLFRLATAFDELRTAL